jgi:methionine biosynthesis protein MetW
MVPAVQALEDRRWSHVEQKVVYRHTQALTWIQSVSHPVIDIGCGDGLFLGWLKERGIPSWGVDISMKAVEVCAAKGLKVYIGDLAEGRLPNMPEAKTALLLDVLEHLYEPEHILSALHGRVEELIISVPNFSSLPARVQVLLGRVPENDAPTRGHIYWFTKAALESRLEETGWKVTEYACNTFWSNKPLVGSLMRWLVKVRPSLFALSFVLRAKRV